VFKGVLGFYNPDKKKRKKKKGTNPIYLGFRIIKSELVKNVFFHPITKEKLSSNSKSESLKGILRRKK